LIRVMSLIHFGENLTFRCRQRHEQTDMHKSQPKDMPSPPGPQYAGFVERLLYRALDSNLKRGKMSTVLNGRIVALPDAQRMVAHARAHGWLPLNGFGDHNDGGDPPASHNKHRGTRGR
jgi:hypothetical protein